MISLVYLALVGFESPLPAGVYKNVKNNLYRLLCQYHPAVTANPFFEIVKVFGAELFVLNVDYENRSFNVDTPEQSVLLHTLLSEVDPSYHFIQHKDIEDGINEFAEKNNLDLIIAIPKKHKLLSSLFNASSSKQLVFQSHMPVMCVHE